MSHDDPFAGKTVQADWGYFLDTAGTYTPVLTGSISDPTLGSGSTQTGGWQRNGHLITGWAFLRFGTSGVGGGSGVYIVSLPFDADLSVMITSTSTLGLSSTLGSGTIRDNSAATANSRQLVPILRTASTCHLVVADGTSSAVTNASPFTVSTEDAISINFAYLADSAGLPA